MKKNSYSNYFGFTLIELLIVIAILGVLAVVVLVAVNPVQQLARTRDAGRKSAIGQVGRTLQAYYTARNATYVTEDDQWLNSLAVSGELSTVPSAITYSIGADDPNCGAGAVRANNLCYDYDDIENNAIVFARMESESEISKCNSGLQPFFVYSTIDGRAGLVCSDTPPTPGNQNWNSIQ
ncbi:MAG: prepilin-type N-terminal cleavage/methylation domain-containing protein [Patescibacteria group bacterium]|nr:prepilin-type N-terminal cleavage/methylation domain-containing protein [Patescibacteria group bacterium]